MGGGWPAPSASPNKYMINKEQKIKVMQRVQELKKNPPKVTEAHHKQAAALLKENKKFYDSKDKSIENERKGLAKDVAGFVHTHLNGVGQLFNGFGEGKRHQCSICLAKATINTMDGQWYCAEHRWFGNLTKEQQLKERSNVNQQNRTISRSSL